MGTGGWVATPRYFCVTLLPKPLVFALRNGWGGGGVKNLRFWRYVICGRSLSICAVRLKKAVTYIERWRRNNWRLPISAEKTSFTLFTRRRIDPSHVLHLTTDGKTIAHKANPRFLRVVLDPKLSLAAHITHVTATVPATRRSMRSEHFSAPSGDIHRHALVTFFKAFIRPNLVYASEVCGTAARERNHAVKFITKHANNAEAYKTKACQNKGATNSTKEKEPHARKKHISAS